MTARAALRDLLTVARQWQAAAFPRKAIEDNATRRKKLAAEAKLLAAITAYFDRLERLAKEALRQNPPTAAAVEYVQATFGAEFFRDTSFSKSLTDILTAAARDGVLQFSDMVSLELDLNTINREAAEAIKTYTFDLISGLNDTTLKTLQDVIGQFITTPGMTMGDVIEALPFNETRSALIATTEITRAYATGQRIAADKTKSEFPDVPISKMWHTNNDDLVCEICGPLDGESVDEEDSFEGDIDEPPAHPGCRCWISYRTNING